MAIDWREFGLAVLVARKRRRMSVRDFAAAVGQPHSTVSRIENGKPCMADAYLDICALAKIDPTQFHNSQANS